MSRQRRAPVVDFERWLVAVTLILLAPLCAWITYDDHHIVELLSDGPITTGTVIEVSEPILVRATHYVRVEFTDQRGERVQLNVERYLEPNREVGQTIEIQYARYDDDEYVAREVGWEPNFRQRWGYLFMGGAGASVGIYLLVSNIRHARRAPRGTGTSPGGPSDFWRSFKAYRNRQPRHRRN
jgi:hypothetical protein